MARKRQTNKTTTKVVGRVIQRQRRQRVGSGWYVVRGRNKYLSLVLNNVVDEQGQPIRLLVVANRLRRTAKSPDVVIYA